MVVELPYASVLILTDAFLALEKKTVAKVCTLP